MPSFDPSTAHWSLRKGLSGGGGGCEEAGNRKKGFMFGLGLHVSQWCWRSSQNGWNLTFKLIRTVQTALPHLLHICVRLHAPSFPLSKHKVKEWAVAQDFCTALHVLHLLPATKLERENNTQQEAALRLAGYRAALMTSPFRKALIINPIVQVLQQHSESCLQSHL